MENFVKRQWDADYKGLVIAGKSEEEVLPCCHEPPEANYFDVLERGDFP